MARPQAHAHGGSGSATSRSRTRFVYVGGLRTLAELPPVSCNRVSGFLAEPRSPQHNPHSSRSLHRWELFFTEGCACVRSLVCVFTLTDAAVVRPVTSWIGNALTTRLVVVACFGIGAPTWSSPGCCQAHTDTQRTHMHNVLTHAPCAHSHFTPVRPNAPTRTRACVAAPVATP